MLSFIVIGYNEERNLRRCFNSIYKTCKFIKNLKYEIIYVDSKSTDKSVQIAKEYQNIRIYSITGKCNAAIGRNIGAKESKGTILFFIDADMELNETFLNKVFDKDRKIKFNLVTGTVIDYVDDVEYQYRIDEEKFISGGIFLIKKDIWDKMTGMRTKYKTGENADLGLRLIKKGFPITRLPETIANHYTIPYLSKSRIWKMIWDKSVFYSRCILYRDHIFNKHMYKFLWKNDKTFICLASFIGISLLLPGILLYLGIAYLLLVGIRSFKQVKHLHVAELFMYFIVFDFLNLIYFFVFFPKAPEPEYKIINDCKTSKLLSN